ncbi:MAG: hypothetical protein QG556_373 [Pseudomonadota bacterium]|nr:hypothetical protein [Pseudomonadota bacterium]
MNYIEGLTGLRPSQCQFYVWRSLSDLPMVKFSHCLQGKVATTDAAVIEWLLRLYKQVYSLKEQKLRRDGFKTLQLFYSSHLATCKSSDIQVLAKLSHCHSVREYPHSQERIR